MRKILLIDNFDSFTYNLYYLIQEHYSGLVEVVRNDVVDIDKLDKYEAIVISPGPGSPVDSGLTMKVIELCYKTKPLLGVCLGMQCINDFFAGKTIRAPKPVHGKQDTIRQINSSFILEGIAGNILVARYHSLMTLIASEQLRITATTKDDIPMIIEHTKLPIYGIQFHPESFLTPKGDVMIKNFLRLLCS